MVQATFSRGGPSTHSADGGIVSFSGAGLSLSAAGLHAVSSRRVKSNAGLPIDFILNPSREVDPGDDAPGNGNEEQAEHDRG
jgi:hypothetical protein